MVILMVVWGFSVAVPCHREEWWLGLVLRVLATAVPYPHPRACDQGG